MQAIVKLVMLLDKLAEFLVALQQEILYFLRFCCAHTPPLLLSKVRDRSLNEKVAQGRLAVDIEFQQTRSNSAISVLISVTRLRRRLRRAGPTSAKLRRVGPAFAGGFGGQA